MIIGFDAIDRYRPRTVRRHVGIAAAIGLSFPPGEVAGAVTWLRPSVRPNTFNQPNPNGDHHWLPLLINLF
jgi:hypothetical protein